MPNVTIYVNEELWEAVREFKIPPSAICQHALWAQVKLCRRRQAREVAQRREQQTNQQEAK